MNPRGCSLEPNPKPGDRQASSPGGSTACGSLDPEPHGHHRTPLRRSHHPSPVHRLPARLVDCSVPGDRRHGQPRLPTRPPHPRLPVSRTAAAPALELLWCLFDCINLKLRTQVFCCLFCWKMQSAQGLGEGHGCSTHRIYLRDAQAQARGNHRSPRRRRRLRSWQHERLSLPALAPAASPAAVESRPTTTGGDTAFFPTIISAPFPSTNTQGTAAAAPSPPAGVAATMPSTLAGGAAARAFAVACPAAPWPTLSPTLLRSIDLDLPRELNCQDGALPDSLHEEMKYQNNVIARTGMWVFVERSLACVRLLGLVAGMPHLICAWDSYDRILSLPLDDCAGTNRIF